MPSKTKLKKILDRIAPLEMADTFAPLEQEINDLMTKVKSSIAIKTVEEANQKFKELRDSIDVSPLLNAIQNLKDEISKRDKELIGQFQESDKQVFLKLKEEIKSKFNSLSKNLEMIGYISTDLNNVHEELLKINQKEQTDFSPQIERLSTRISNLKDDIYSQIENTDFLRKEIKKLEVEREKFRIETLQRFSSLGGGSQNRQIKVEGTDVLTKYTDINLIAGNGIAITTSANDTNKNVGITFTAGSLVPITPTGTVNGINTVFVFTTAPSIIVVDQGRIMQKTSSDGSINWTGTTTVTLTVAPTFDIYGI